MTEFKGFTSTNNLNFLDSVRPEQRGKTISVTDMYGSKVTRTTIGDVAVHDANFAFLSTTLAKLHKEMAEPLYWVTWSEDIPFETGGGFVDYVEYYTIDWAGIMNEQRNLVGNSVNYIPRVNAGANQKRVNVFTYEVAYDLRFIELEKMKKLTLQKSIQEIYNNVILAGWDLFVQNIAYLGANGSHGLFNADTLVKTFTVDNHTTTYQGFDGMQDDAVVAFINGIYETYLKQTNGAGGAGNTPILPDTILVPTFVMSDLVSRYSPLYSNTLYDFVLTHNLGLSQSGKKMEITIQARPALDNIGTAGKGRIVAYRKNKSFVRIDLPYPIQHYITLPNIEKMSYTTAFVGQVSEIQLPYNTSSSEFGVVTYWDFTN